MESIFQAVPTPFPSNFSTFSVLSESKKQAATYNKVTFDLFRNASEFPYHFEELKRNYTASHKTDDGAQEMIKIDMQKKAILSPFAGKHLQRLTAPTPAHSPVLSHMHIPAHVPVREQGLTDALAEVRAAAPRVTFAAQVEHFPTDGARASPQLPPAAPEPTPASAKAKAEYEAYEHQLQLSELAEALATDINILSPEKSSGLDSVEAEERLRVYGKNALHPPKQRHPIFKFLLNFANFFMILLEVAGVLCFVAYALDTTQKINLYLGVVLWVIVTITCTISFIQERQSSSIMNSFRNLLPMYCTVLRSGRETKVPVENLVVGDIVHVSAGDKIPADIRIIKSTGFKVDNSSLTGESDPQLCTTECTDSNPLESHNLAFYGTLAMDGTAYGVVIKTGPDTLIGKIADLASNTTTTQTNLHKEITRFVRFISVLGLLMGGAFFGIGVSKGVPLVANMISVLGIIVANVPEGLPSTVTACLTVTARRLSKRNVYVKQMASVETLGSITCIASDKTGTLTQNRMTVSHMWYDGEIMKAIDAGTLGRKQFDIRDIACKHMLRIAAVSNRAKFDEAQEGNMEKPIDNRLILGDASESALVRMCEKLQPIEESRAAYPKIFEIPFNSSNKWQVTIHRQAVKDEDLLPGTTNTQRILMLKGAPEIVFEKCSRILVQGKEVKIDDHWRAAFQQAYEALGSMGERVLGFAELYLDERSYGALHDDLYDGTKINFPMRELVFVGLASLLDPPRETVPFALGQCKAAGIKVMMVTGDHPITAKAIARKVGIITGDTREDIALREGRQASDIDPAVADAVVVHGSALTRFTDDDWDTVLSKQQIVFARTSPQQKSIIVEQCQRRGEVVAVTGDGVNDSPALKRADIGIAMGIVGSDVAKETADVILLDDNFASIVAGIEEGRIIFDNLKKSICYTLSHLLPELLPFLLFSAASFPLALTSVLILCIDLGTELAPAISLAYERGEANTMTRKPRNVKKDHLVTPSLLANSYLMTGVLETLACFASFCIVLMMNGFQPLSMFNNNPYFLENSPAYVTAGGVSHSAAQQMGILAQAQTAYFLTLVICQVFNLLSCKTRITSLFKHGMKNWMVNGAIIVSLSISVILIYIPGMSTVFGTAPLLPLYWAIPVPMAMCVLLWNELRKLICRTWPNGVISKLLAW
jgi:sodium/potassium-transporting ATPase subunit alpha